MKGDELIRLICFYMGNVSLWKLVAFFKAEDGVLKGLPLLQSRSSYHNSPDSSFCYSSIPDRRFFTFCLFCHFFFSIFSLSVSLFPLVFWVSFVLNLSFNAGVCFIFISLR